MKPEFVEGDYVFYNNPGHSWHMMMFILKKIEPSCFTPGGYSPGGYRLEYGNRTLLATFDQVLSKKDPRVQHLVINPTPYQQLADSIAQVNQHSPKTLDEHYSRSNDRIAGKSPALGMPYGNPHEGHEIVENYALGKAFKYCRKCKVEVQ